MQASKEVWAFLMGTINTQEKFLARRRHLAENEWTRLKSNDSLECYFAYGFLGFCQVN
jgi:cytochrome c-type protein NapC